MLLQIITECLLKLVMLLLMHVFEAVKKICNTTYDYKDTLDGTGLFYNVALPMLEKLEVMPEFEEAGDTAVREAMYQKLEDAGIIPLY